MLINIKATTESMATQPTAERRDFSPPRRRWRWSPPLQVTSALRRKLLRRQESVLEDIAEKSWQIAPGAKAVSRRAFFLPNQLERVTGTAYMYSDNVQREMAGGIETFEVPTRGYLVKNAWLLDGALYKGNSRNYLYPSMRRLPRFGVDYEVDRAAIYSSFDGMDFFGLWLTDDCSTYGLAASEGVPVTSNQPVSTHSLEYEDWLGMKPVRLGGAFLREVVLFDDTGQNLHKRARFRALGDKLRSRVKVEPHPGVFILRRGSGKRRILHNEMEVAQHLRDRRGFRVLDITMADVPTIVAACAGARVIAGVEGSHLVHGIMVLQPGGSVLTLQPPNRFCAVIKRTTDPDNQHFGFVVGHPEEGGFRVDPGEVERTLDLFPA